MPEDMIRSLTPSRMQEMLHAAGYRAETVTVGGSEILRSATNGLSFEIRFANPVPPEAGGGFADCSLMTALSIQGEFPLATVNRWNTERRFARLFVNAGMLVLVMDVNILGGVGEEFLKAQLVLWDRLVPDLLQFLREGSSLPVTPEKPEKLNA